MIRRVVLVVVATIFAIGTGIPPVAAQPPRPAPATSPPAAAPAQEIKLDETTSLKASALESRMAAIVANFALLQRQAQDLQHEMKQLLDDRKTLIEEAARRDRVEVGDANQWAYEAKNQRYVKIKRTR